VLAGCGTHPNHKIIRTIRINHSKMGKLNFSRRRVLESKHNYGRMNGIEANPVQAIGGPIARCVPGLRDVSHIEVPKTKDNL